MTDEHAPDDAAIEQLEQLYASLPQIDCQGLCWNSCGPISMSAVERRRIEARGVQIQEFSADRSRRWSEDEPLHCNALTKWHRCSVHEIRPLVCRIWGVGRGSLGCPWGCTMTGPRLKHQQVIQLLLESFRIGGPDRDMGAVTSADDVVTAAVMADPVASVLMLRVTNGERHLLPELEIAIHRVVTRLRDEGRLPS